jgi:hypothetical protein
MADSNLVLDTTRTRIAIAARNQRMIAELIMPVVQVASVNFTYMSYNDGELMIAPDTQVGPRGEGERYSFGNAEIPAKAVDHALFGDVTPTEQAEAVGVRDPLDGRTEFLANLMMLRQEVMTAGLVFNPASYLPANVAALAGASQWNDAASKPLTAIKSRLDGAFIRPNKIVMGQAVWTAVSMNPSVVRAAGNTSGEGIVSRQKVAEMLEVEEILVGEGWVNLANHGQPAAMARVWGKSCAGVFVDPMISNGSTFSWGATFKTGTRKVMTGFNPRPGANGLTDIKVSEQRQALVIARQAGFLFQTAVA